ncbi:nucleoside deaminase [Sulfuricurvum sp.]|uniref:nucleoside deaminase n=1 Tax=Sulfuricurvum sp. TaxID=2025608 RepID=UPI002E30012A|nr:nucleoside deaminase [Sulfuricurvum sp.]HEX5328731.1 nucleoside deaminase [Sulfuricurvum sp.]
MHKWIQIAYDEALKGMEANEGGPFGAAIVCNGELIASAHNTVLQSNDPTAHAEINVIRKASQTLGKFDLSDCILYTTCYPCPMCMGAILWARIPTLYYSSSMDDAAKGGFDDQAFYALYNKPQDAINITSIDSDEGKKLFSLWNDKEDRKLY